MYQNSPVKSRFSPVYARNTYEMNKNGFQSQGGLVVSNIWGAKLERLIYSIRFEFYLQGPAADTQYLCRMGSISFGLLQGS